MATDRQRPNRQQRLLGHRGRLALAAFRLPLWLYRHDCGWMLGHTFLMFEHVGRKTGRSHHALAMVLADNRATGEVVICSAWGPHADWVLNLVPDPHQKSTSVASDSYPITGSSLTKKHPKSALRSAATIPEGNKFCIVHPKKTLTS
jgi:hypothetical protein